MTKAHLVADTIVLKSGFLRFNTE